MHVCLLLLRFPATIRDAAFRWLDQAVEQRDSLIMPITSYAFLDPVRGDARYQALLRKMRLAQEQAARRDARSGA